MNNSDFSKLVKSAETIMEKKGFAEKVGRPLAEEEINEVAGGFGNGQDFSDLLEFSARREIIEGQNIDIR